VKDLVGTLRGQHEAALKLVGTINERLAAKDIPGVNAALTQLKNALLAHLELEDKKLYPALINAAEAKKNSSLASTTRMFSSNMVGITETLKSFLAKFEGKQFDPKAFETEWKAVVGALGARINSEEATLYPMYQQWVSPT
jgi:hypothetical protein